MSRLSTAFVLGYHGCERDVALKIVGGTAQLVPSDKPYDWLGPGVYFWESDRHRAWEWAQAQCRRKGGDPCVIGAAIDLGNCLDLLSRGDQELLRNAYTSLAALYAAAGQSLPKNENLKDGGDTDRRLRKLDCAVIRHLLQLNSDDGDGILPAFDTVRGMFTEGLPLYPGSGFHEQSHVQIAVRNPSAIKGVFLPPDILQPSTV